MKRVLIVDDDYDICEAIQLLLETQYEVSVAHNGEQALARIEATQPFDAILLDLMMPVMDGEAFFAELLRRGSAPPVIFASAAPQLPARAHFAGAAGFLRKPFDASQLESTLEGVVSGGGPDGGGPSGPVGGSSGNHVPGNGRSAFRDCPRGSSLQRGPRRITGRAADTNRPLP